MNITGKVLLWAGFLSGSLATVFQANDESGLGLTIPWFVVSVLIAGAGIVIIWISKSVTEDEEKTLGDIDILHQSIANLVNQSAELNKIQDDLAPSKLVDRIDEWCAVDFQNFAESRKSIIPLFGLTKYAEVMTQFAAGERAMNRVWSAAADGYVDEVRVYLAKSQVHLQETQNLLRAFKRAGSSGLAETAAAD